MNNKYIVKSKRENNDNTNMSMKDKSVRFVIKSKQHVDHQKCTIKLMNQQ